MLAVLRLREWVLGLFRVGFGTPPAMPPAPVELVPGAALGETEPALPLTREENAALTPAKKPRRRQKKKWNEVSAWNARLRSPLVDE
ncbi:hypothetical protein [Myxococcus sp. AB025B]|uniref:hypothetical protein n=1 Tax=Myxococcus sp. AB025B TaxID=2562794 RepID=UPI001142F211|nr:hypothetical protein [Myxococcus sp. AB025B]